MTPKEAKVYSDMSGTRYENTEQLTVSETPLLSDHPAVSYSTRSTLNRVPEITPSEFTYRDFQEATLYTVCDGDPLRPFAIKTEFVLKSEKKSMPRVKTDWDMYPPRFADMQPYCTATATPMQSRIYGQTPLAPQTQPSAPVYAREPVGDQNDEYSTMMFGCGRTASHSRPESRVRQEEASDESAEKPRKREEGSAAQEHRPSYRDETAAPPAPKDNKSHTAAFEAWFEGNGNS